ncbi:apolipoprotein N-acyltransferase [Pseudoduganella namucuonensis]|uniref:Apolipoprotein N-acyltransferase n=1 Tax=Pseudoduganella namucuonensis TaxID=1035707 RepID=A0A1I7LJF7_9BURK|nr:apolipoprotein N-acyltransferase [Pseudoduganella namucuonensis]SFV09818.1 Apolipoprotein N-acyltransferase [Pseudoduganella namucuonensis]
MRFRRAAATDTPPPQRSTRSRMIIAALAGAASVFSFAPFGWWPVQILCLSLLFYQALRAPSVRDGAWVGWAFGFGWCLANVHWLVIALNRFGGLALPLAVVSIALLAALMGGYAAMAMYAGLWLRRRWALPLPAAALLVLPAMWAVFEWVRGWLFTGFSWASAGYAHNDAPLGGFAPVVGVYGVGWLAAVCAGALLLAAHRARWAALGAFAALFAVGFGLKFVEWTTPVGQPISVRLVQGNTPLLQKFDASHTEATLRRYYNSVTAEAADLVATPETAVMLFPHQLPPDYLPALGQFAKRSGSHLVLGIPLMDSPTQYANSVIGLPPDTGLPTYRYDKHHLVPFGEFIPPGFRWFTNMMQIPLGDQTRGKLLQAPFQVKSQRVLPNICYENLFGEEIAEQLASDPRPATLLLNVSELAWYGESIAIPQHLQISQMRSLETGRPMLSATNNGATVVIDSHGKVTAALPYYQAGVLKATVRGTEGTTPYILLANKLFLALAALAVAGAWLWSRKNAKNAANGA